MGKKKGGRRKTEEYGNFHLEQNLVKHTLNEQNVPFPVTFVKANFQHHVSFCTEIHHKSFLSSLSRA